MIPKEKAKELLIKFDVKHEHKIGLPISMYTDQIKQCTLLCVDEVLKELDHIMLSVNDETRYDIKNYVIKHWEEVKEELNKQ